MSWTFCIQQSRETNIFNYLIIYLVLKAERRMYHLSTALTGVVLPHDTYGTHLVNGKTVDEALEIRNFEAAGQALGALWSELVIDGYVTTAEYISEPPDQAIVDYSSTPKFRTDHVFESQYMFVYLKCTDRTCCDEFVTNVELFFPHRRIPTLIPIKRTELGIEPLERSEAKTIEKVEFLSLTERVVFNGKLQTKEVDDKYGSSVPYDVYLPSVEDKIDKRVCSNCKKYHATQKSLKLHKEVCKKPKKSKKKKPPVSLQVESSSSEEEEVTDIVDVESEEVDEYEHVSNLVNIRPQYSVVCEGEFVERIMDLKEWLKSPWTADYNNN